jgi:hypothetical protein
MGKLHPVVATRYSPAAGSLARLISPPSEFLTAAQIEDVTAAVPHHILNLAAPAPNRSERSRFVKFARSGALNQEWNRDGILQADDYPQFYHLSITGRKREPQNGIFALVPLDEFEDASAPDADFRLLLEATRTWFEPAIATITTPIPEPGYEPPVAETELDGITYTLTPISDPDEIAEIEKQSEDWDLTLISGQGRITAAQAFAERKPNVPERETYALVLILEAQAAAEPDGPLSPVVRTPAPAALSNAYLESQVIPPIGLLTWNMGDFT